MGIDERDYMRDRNRGSYSETLRFQTSEQKKQRQAEALRIRFAKYSSSLKGTSKKFRWKRYLLISLVFAIGATLLTRMPHISSRFLLRQTAAQFPATGTVQWFVPAEVNGVGGVAPLTIIGLADIGRNVVVKLDTWDTHTPIAMIPIRGGESTTLQVPLGRYRITYAPNATWQGDFKLTGDVQEGVEPLDFYRSGNQVIGRRIDLNGRINGNLKTRRTSYF